MWTKLLIFTTLTILSISAEPPLQKSAPYPAAGWRPRRPFNLPGEYLPPTEIIQQQQQRPQVDYEITKARVDYIGQVQENRLVNTRQPQKAYAPPNREETDFLKVQQLPYETTRQPYYKPPAQQQQYFPQRKPAQKYGPPPTALQPPQNVDFNIIYPDPRSLEETPTISGGDVADFSAPEVADEPSDFKPSAPNAVRAKQGQYFVLGPDNTLQRVTFTTTQDEEERQSNGFTAQLKYTPVGELKDPVFRYNNRGQLVRVLKK